MTKEIQGDLILTENTTFEENLIVHGDIRCENGIWNINAYDIKAWNISYYAVVFAYNSFKCESVNGRRKNSKHFCLDKEIEFKGRKYGLVEK